MPLDLKLNDVASASLADFTRPELIIPTLHQRDTAGIISELSHALQRRGCIADVLPFYHAALNGELLANSTMECGVAFPHARLSGVKQLWFAFGRVPEPVIWGAKGSCCVQLIFLVAVPATNGACYLHLLAGLARLGQQAEQLAELHSARSAKGILAVLEKAKLRQE